MKKTFVLLCSLFSLICINQAFAQEITPASSLSNSEPVRNDPSLERDGFISRLVHHKDVALKFSYFGEIMMHPGLSVGVDYTLSSKKWVTLHWDTELGGYWHRWNHKALFAKTSIGTRFPFWSFFIDLNVGIGYMHTIPAGDMYEESSSGEVEKVMKWGHSHVMPSLSLLLGWDGGRHRDLPWRIFFGPELYYQTSFNHIMLPHAAAKLGLTYKF